MNKTLGLSILCLSLTIIPGPIGAVINKDKLAATGFEVRVDNREKLELFHSIEKTFIISKQAFTRESEAHEFCHTQAGQLDKDFNILLLAMSGASEASEFIANAIRFDERGNKGIQAWSGLRKEEVIRMYDDEDNELKTLKASHISKESKKTLPAICLKV